MAMTASCKITNNTGSEIVITSMGQVNDDASFQAPPAGTKYANGESFTISMGNDSFPLAPKGVGFDMGFICLGNTQIGGVYLDDPAVGSHSFSYGNTKSFAYTTENPGGNVYDVNISSVN